MSTHSNANNSANALFTLGIIGLIAIVILALFSSFFSNVSGHTRVTAQKQAEYFFQVAGIDAIAQCVNNDSDGDGYVSCPYTTKDGVTHPLECAGPITTNTGCRMPKQVFVHDFR